MAVTCPGCGRQYDVTLFAWGRTIDCACGERVGERHERRMEGEPRFLCDAMLGDLARWLRVLDLDAAWERDAEDATLVRRAIEEERWLVTRDRRLPEEWRFEGCLVVESTDPLLSLREVVREVGIDEPRPLLQRCLECNTPLVEAPPEAVERYAPPHVRKTCDEFRACPDCGRVYWEGSHAARMRRRVRRALGWPAPDDSDSGGRP